MTRMKFSVIKPSIFLYKTDNLMGEVSDELLFGTTLEILSENETVAFCCTDYGYSGYLNRWDICECMTPDCGEHEKSTVYRRCDLLTEPRYRLAPYISLPKGSRITVLQKMDGRFSICLAGSRKVYIPNSALEKNTDVFSGSAIAQAARSYLGAPYRWGGKTENGIGCSGLVFMSCSLCGAMIWRDSAPDLRYVDIIGENEADVGDIAYFDGHVAVMTGKDSFVHASASLGYVTEGNFSSGHLLREDVVCYGRVKGGYKE